jgi:alcohol dehydrogenase class IV
MTSVNASALAGATIRDVPHAVRMPVAGPGALATLGGLSRSLCANRPPRPRALVVVGAGFDGRPWADRVPATLREIDATIHRHAGVTTPESVVNLCRVMQNDHIDVVIALGGGTVMDAAKAAAALAGVADLGEAELVEACFRGVPAPTTTIPVIAVPTTPGTGAEVTPFATVWDVASGRKLSLVGPQLRPQVSILDPDLLSGLGQAALASAALDTICQGAEAAWSVRSTPASIAHGLTALGLIGTALERIEKGDLGTADRLALLLAGHHSGHAIAIAPTSSCHALSYPLTLRLGLSHGHACGVTFPRMVRFNAAITERDCHDPRGPQHVRCVLARVAESFGLACPAQVAERVDGFLAGCGLPNLSDLPITAESLVTEALSYARCHDNPRRLDGPILTRLLTIPVGREELCP